MKKEEESTSEFSIFNFQVSILNLFVTFVSYLKEYGRTGTDIIIETEQ